MPFSQYLETNGVSGAPVAPDKLTDLTVSIPTPPGWQKVDKPNIPPTTEVIAKGDGFPNAMLVVFKLAGTSMPPSWSSTATTTPGSRRTSSSSSRQRLTSTAFPSSMIEGSYNLGNQRLHTINRIVIATGSGSDPDRYLVQLAVTSLADKAVADAVDVEAIMHGFTVAAK